MVNGDLCDNTVTDVLLVSNKNISINRAGTVLDNANGIHVSARKSNLPWELHNLFNCSQIYEAIAHVA